MRNLTKGLFGLAVAAILANAAVAQTTIEPAQNPPAKYKCRPALVGGEGKNFRITGSATHAVFMWGCLGLDNEWKNEGFIWEYGYIPKLPSLATYLKASDLFDAFWEANVVDFANQWPQEVMDMEALLWSQIKPTLPVPPVYAVAPNSTYLTRPVSILLDGKAAPPPVKGLTVPVGTLCEMKRGAFTSGTVTYGAVPLSAVQPATSTTGITYTLYAVCRPKS